MAHVKTVKGLGFLEAVLEVVPRSFEGGLCFIILVTENQPQTLKPQTLKA